MHVLGRRYRRAGIRRRRGSDGREFCRTHLGRNVVRHDLSLVILVLGDGLNLMLHLLDLADDDLQVSELAGRRGGG